MKELSANMNKKLFPIIPPMPVITIPTLRKPCIIFDIDGVLADVPIIEHLNWDDVNTCTILMRNHPPDWRLMELLNFFYSSDKFAILLATCRPERYRAVTIDWLTRHKAQYHDLWMRADNDARSDVQVKFDMYKKLSATCDVKFVVEDRNKVVQMWRDLGVLCLQPRLAD